MFDLKTRDTEIIQQNKMLRGGQTINLRARQLVYALASQMDRNDPEEMISMDAKQFLAWVNSGSETQKWSNIYVLTADIFKNLNDNPILIRKSRGYQKINWLSSLGVEDGRVIGRFSKDSAHYFKYKQGFPYTRILWDLRDYKSGYTARIMDLFQNNHIKDSGRNEFSFDETIEDLKFFFGVHKKYSVFKDFDRRVLKVTCDELEANTFSPYWFEYEKIRKGRFIHKIRFMVHVRPKVLIELVPRLKSMSKPQMSMFDESVELELSQTGKVILHDLKELKFREEEALRFMNNLSYTQALGFCELVAYGVNRSLAHSLILNHCSFSQYKGYEHEYVKFVLKKLEKDRIKRIMEAKKGSKKKTTPDDARGGLVKLPLRDKRYLPEFGDYYLTIKEEWKEEDEPLFVESKE